jgi:hypothetical protein
VNNPYVEDVDGGPLGGDAGNRERPPPMSETLMASPLGGDAGNREHPPPMSKTSMEAPLGGGARDPGVPTTYVEDVDGGPPREVQSPSMVPKLCCDLHR